MPIAQHNQPRRAAPPWYQIQSESNTACALQISGAALILALAAISCCGFAKAIDPTTTCYIGLGFSATLFTTLAIDGTCVKGEFNRFFQDVVVPIMMVTMLSVILFAWSAFSSFSPLPAYLAGSMVVAIPTVTLLLVGAVGIVGLVVAGIGGLGYELIHR